METETHKQTAPTWATPVAIVVAGALVALAVFVTRSDISLLGDKDNKGEETRIAGAVIALAESDHVKGNRNAAVRVIEYSDMECPFCKMFHVTMNQIIEEYGDRVAWVYRHFPIKSKSAEEAIATECVAELGGNDKFWAYLDKFYQVTPSNDQTDLNILPRMAVELGINENDFKACMQSGKYDELLNRQYNEAIQTGATGTPWSLVVTRSGQVISINGAQPYEVVKQIIQTALNE
jgi:protein-disulfide isomerase